MHEKQIPRQEWNCIKCPGRVVGDQFLNSQHAWACWDMVARAIVFEIPRMTVKCTLSVTKWIDNLSSVLDTDGVKQKTSLIFVQGKSAWYCFIVFFFCFRHLRPVHEVNAKTPITAILFTYLLHEFIVNVNWRMDWSYRKPYICVSFNFLKQTILPTEHVKLLTSLKEVQFPWLILKFVYWLCSNHRLRCKCISKIKRRELKMRAFTEDRDKNI